jgi:hypothetical protein
MNMRAKDVCQKAADLVGGDRAKAHGNMWDTHECAAILWNAYLKVKREVGADIGAEDVALMLLLLKVARSQSGQEGSEDNYIDMAGYAGVAGELCSTHIKIQSEER